MPVLAFGGYKGDAKDCTGSEQSRTGQCQRGLVVSGLPALQIYKGKLYKRELGETHCFASIRQGKKSFGR